MHEYAPVVITLVAIVVGIVFNRNESREVRNDLNIRLDKVDQRLLVIESDLRSFYTITG